MYYDIYVGAGGMSEWFAGSAETLDDAMQLAKKFIKLYGENRVTIHPRRVAAS